MSTATETLPIADTARPEDQAAVAEAVRGAYVAAQAIYPIGGGTSLDYGAPARTPGLGLQLSALNRMIDYPARDMTITVEAGITMAELTRTLAAERQRLPIDVPQASEATLGGVIATNFNGPRRFGLGTVRDYVIGIAAIDGRGVSFKGGGRVVKNVAGYDFCKLLTGSLGTLGVITQVTLKVKPIPACMALVACPLADWQHAERLLAALVQTRTAPSAVEVVSGAHWSDLAELEPIAGSHAGHLLVALEGSESEVRWMLDTLAGELEPLASSAGGRPRKIEGPRAEAIWSRLVEFPAHKGSPLVLKGAVLPSRIVEFLQVVQASDPQCSIQAHAANGIAIVHCSQFPQAGLSRMLIATLQPSAARCGGSLTILSAAQAGELTHPAVWGNLGEAAALMTDVKKMFDPKGLLNPGRFI